MAPRPACPRPQFPSPSSPLAGGKHAWPSPGTGTITLTRVPLNPRRPRGSFMLPGPCTTGPGHPLPCPTSTLSPPLPFLLPHWWQSLCSLDLSTLRPITGPPSIMATLTALETASNLIASSSKVFVSEGCLMD